MNKYYLLVNGCNFLLADFSSKLKVKGIYLLQFRRITKTSKNYYLKKMGFWTNMFVTAQTPKEAEMKAISILRKDKMLKDFTLNEPNDQPVLRVEEITEIETFKGCRRPREGLAFYREKQSKRSKQTSNSGAHRVPKKKLGAQQRAPAPAKTRGEPK